MGRCAFFQPLVNSFKEINSNPIQLSNGYYIILNLGMSLADLLGLHQLQNIGCSFRWNSCQYCDVGCSDKLKEFHSFKLGNRANESPLSDTHVFKELDLKGRIFAPDIFHILNEGDYSSSSFFWIF